MPYAIFERGFKLLFPHLTRPENWQAYRLSMWAYAKMLGLEDFLRSGPSGHGEEEVEAANALTPLITCSISNKIAYCLSETGWCTEWQASDIWEVLNEMMDASVGQTDLLIRRKFLVALYDLNLT